MFLGFDTKFSRFMHTLVDVFFINIMWILGSLPIITIGISTIAAYTVTLKMIEDKESQVVKQFWQAYIKNLKHGIILSILLLISGYAAFMCFYLFETVSGNPIYFLIIGMVLIYFILINFFFVFPIEARYKNTVFRSLTISRHVFLRFYAKNLILILIVFAEFWLFFAINIVLIIIGACIGVEIMIYTISGAAVHYFKIMEKEEAEISGKILPNTYLDIENKNQD